jgi:hypothetical protein
MKSKKELLEIQEEKMARKKEEVQEILQHECKNHNRKPITRRQLLASGIQSYGLAYTAAPFMGALLNPNRAQAQECPGSGAGATNTLPAFVTLSLAGGWGAAGNMVPMGLDGQPLSDYRRIGLGSGTPPIVRAFNNVPFAGNNIGRFLPGLQSTASAAAIANTGFLAIWVQNQNDSNSGNHDPLDISGMVAKAGLSGEIAPAIGSRSSDTGNKHDYAIIKPPNSSRVRSFNDLQNVLGTGGARGALAGLNQNQRIQLREMVQKLSQRQISSVMQEAGGVTMARLVECATGKNIETLQATPPNPDIRQDANLAGAWGVNANSAANDQNVAFGSMVTAGLRGTVGTVSLEMGGYDYHGRSRQDTDQRDFNAGTVIGSALETAHILQRKTVINIISDGAVRSETSDDPGAPWRGDNSDPGAIIMFFYDPAGRPEMTGFQVGGLNNAQAADPSFFTGDNPTMASAAAFANYCAFAGNMGLVESTIPGVMSAAQINQALKIGV